MNVGPGTTPPDPSGRTPNGIGVLYRSIVADPPWDYGADHKRWPKGDSASLTRSAIPYPPMSLDEIMAVPVGAIADRGSRLFLWTTNRFLPASFDVLAAWGFTYRQILVWNKTGASPYGGSVARNSAEFLLVADRGSVPIVARAPSSVITASKLSHSAKPDAFLDLVEHVSPGPYLELFARRQRLGWDTWGNEALNHVEMAS